MVASARRPPPGELPGAQGPGGSATAGAVSPSLSDVGADGPLPRTVDASDAAPLRAISQRTDVWDRDEGRATNHPGTAGPPSDPRPDARWAGRNQSRRCWRIHGRPDGCSGSRAGAIAPPRRLMRFTACFLDVLSAGTKNLEPSARAKKRILSAPR